MKLRLFFPMFLAIFCLMPIDLLQAHGIAESTVVKTSKGLQSIETIKPRERIIAYNIKLKQELKTSVRTTGYSTSNCYVRIRLHTPEIIEHEDILCTPTQEFYRLIDSAWIPAAQLNIGDVLRSNTHGSLAITHIELIKEPLNVYILEVKKYHNFFIGKHALLTHNTTLPWEVAIGISIPIGEAATGGAAGSFFGPIGIIGGIVVGSILGCGLHYVANQDKIYQYDAFFDAQIINALIKGSLNTPSQSKNVPPGGGPSSPQEPDKDPDKNSTIKERITIFENNAQHIFRNKDGHFKSDTLKNRKVLEDLVTDEKNYLGSDKWGKKSYAAQANNGKQIWAEVINNKIRNAGINYTPRTFDPRTGLARSFKPPKK